ncbi:L,D-transpeptidase family protein [Acinetobacter gerneri]|uniref:L,D-transpeptidase family protein n=1 Tax=Acinetobacter gerneri TaxID=202952 RepID=A0AAW8JIG3_9GAMM|nr:L,D-transpeptidase family protein [Acinetobacter gerneri]MDQ9009334.1 L,D-transpeptidase family protein [Acinetobacter gerneri]MDQ9013464.1 L,D-transpeptidase family protein [Acinetobacter gerneri]MDQ9024746.1 L,D-transpeptidase family protein [Acinetobacter gerneri]MDQ9052136.1 L,D-transpeptidase family protein [Acinetobacter gerneri]MDQ9059509.1 L,D-transpeptidase family protein [Acinetobacter gerneri]
MKKYKLVLAALIVILLSVSLYAYKSYNRFIPTTNIALQTLTQQQMADIRKQTPITELRVYKSKRTLELVSHDQIIRTYPMRLGFDPLGHKKQEGDGKTPEGRYSLDWRNPNSAFYKSFHISYPNQQDKAQAKARGVSPGGDVMIHGSTTSKINNLPEMMNYLPQKDWTFGCIAIRNVDIDELWTLVDDHTPIIIYP